MRGIDGMVRAERGMGRDARRREMVGRCMLRF